MTQRMEREHAAKFRPQWRDFMVNIISPAIVTFGLFLCLIFAFILPTMKRNIIERKKEMIRELTQTAWSELAGTHEQETRGTLTREAAQQAAIDRVRAMRYGPDGKDYFWISDTRAHMVMHPYRMDLNGRNLLDYADPAGKKLFVEITRVAAEQGDGYVDYLWQWKDDENHVVPKLSYVKSFGPWGWIVGTGIYLEDVRAEINGMVRRVVWISVGISTVIAALLAYIIRQGMSLERRRSLAEAALRESGERYRLLVEETSQGMLLVLQGRPVYANRNLLNRLGYSAAELPNLQLDMILEALAEDQSAEPGAERHARLISKSGARTDVLATSAPVTIDGAAGQILTLKEVAARRNSEQTIGRRVAELQSMLPLATRAIRASSLPLATCALDTPITQAAAAMARAKCSAILVLAPDGAAVGIVTDQDLRNRVLAAGRDASSTIATVMSAPLVRIKDRALLFEAARVMQEREVNHLVVTDDRGTTCGILTATEILHAQGHAIATLLGEIRDARTPGEVRDSRAKLPVFVKSLLDGGARVETVTRIMTAVSDAVLLRLIGLAEAELGPAPLPFAFVVLGSEAREEQTLATDQDNAILYADPAPEAAAAARDYFLRLGERVCAWLDLAGYSRCQGEVMACNPKWCKPLAEWREFYTTCVTMAAPQNLHDANIFLDLRCVHGEAGFASLLREHLHDLLDGGARDPFFFHLTQTTLRFKAPRGFFGNIQLESAGDHAAFNIKASIIPLVNFARIYALRHRLLETNTLDRLSALRDLGILLPSSHDEMAQAYIELMQLRLAHQAAQTCRGDAPDNFLDPTEITQIERSMLKKIFADITVFQARLQSDFARTS
jgi:PAS domain S-box-containing protein